MRLGMVVNPSAERADEAVRLVRLAAGASGHEVVAVLETTVEGMGRPEARELLDARVDRVVAAGGDGTMRAVAQELVGASASLGLVPLGTANILARNLGLRPRRLEAAVASALVPGSAPVDVGRVRWQLADGSWSADEYFFVLAGVGHDAATVGLVDRAVKARLGWLAYFAAGARTALRRPFLARVDQGSGPRGVPVWSLLVGNAPLVPPGIELFPGAELADRRLHLLLVRVEHPWHWADVAVAGLLRRRAVGRRLQHTALTSLSLQLDEPQPLQLDGDVFGPTHRVDFTVLPGAVHVASTRRSPKTTTGRTPHAPR